MSAVGASVPEALPSAEALASGGSFPPVLVVVPPHPDGEPGPKEKHGEKTARTVTELEIPE